MKKFLIIKDTVCAGKRVYAGDVVDIAESEGYQLIAIKKAEIYVEKPKAAESDRSVGLEKSQTKAPKKRTKS